MWRSGSFTRLSPLQPSGQGLWLYFLTCPESTSIPGAIVAGRAQLSETLGWSEKAFMKAFQECFAEGMVKADWKARLIWCRNSLKINPPNNPNVLKNWSHHYLLLPDCELKHIIYQDIKAFVDTLGKGFHKAFMESFGYISNSNSNSNSINISSLVNDGACLTDKPRARIKYPDDFSLWFANYHPERKVGKKAALREWNKTKGDRPELTIMLTNLKAQVKMWSIEKIDKKYIPHPERYLKNHRWDDVLVTIGDKEKFKRELVDELKKDPGNYSDSEIESIVSMHMQMEV
jgi:hypothetical protein